MRILRSFAALILIAGTWWSMAELIRSSDTIESGTARVIAFSPPPRSMGGLDIIDTCDHCNADAAVGMGLSIVITILGGGPIAMVTFFLQWLVGRGSLPSSTQPLLFAAFVFQLAAAVLSLGLVISFLLLEPAAVILEPSAWYLSFSGIAAAFSMPVLFRLRVAAQALSAAPDLCYTHRLSASRVASPSSCKADRCSVVTIELRYRVSSSSAASPSLAEGPGSSNS